MVFIKVFLTVFLLATSIFIFSGLNFIKNSYAGESSNPDYFKPSYKFMVAGHVYGDYPLNKKVRVFNQAFSAVLDMDSLHEFKFIVLTGDFIVSGEEVNKIALETELKKYPMPFYFVTGNHEKTWDEEGHWNRKEYLKWIGKDNTHYSFFWARFICGSGWGEVNGFSIEGS